MFIRISCRLATQNAWGLLRSKLSLCPDSTKWTWDDKGLWAGKTVLSCSVSFVRLDLLHRPCWPWTHSWSSRFNSSGAGIILICTTIPLWRSRFACVCNMYVYIFACTWIHVHVWKLETNIGYHFYLIFWSPEYTNSAVVSKWKGSTFLHLPPLAPARAVDTGHHSQLGFSGDLNSSPRVCASSFYTEPSP